METFVRLVGLALICVILSQILKKQSTEQAVLLSLGAVSMMVLGAAAFLSPVAAFFSRLEKLGSLDHEMLRILMKATGVGILAEIAALICTDGGEQAMGKAVEIAGAGAVLWLSLPMLTALLELVERVLSNV